MALTRSPCSAIDSDIQVKKIYGVGDDVGLVFLLLTLNIFNIFFWCFYWWLWIIKCWPSNYLLSRKTSTQKVCYKSSRNVPEQFVKSVQNGQQDLKSFIFTSKLGFMLTRELLEQILLIVLIFLTSKVSSKFNSHNMTETIFCKYFTRGLYELFANCKLLDFKYPWLSVF